MNDERTGGYVGSSGCVWSGCYVWSGGYAVMYQCRQSGSK